MVLRKLIDNLRVRSPLERSTSEMAAVLAATRASWGRTPSLPSRRTSYTRTCAYKDGLFEVLLLKWDAGAVSALHDHGGQHCWMLVLDGTLKVDDYVRLDDGSVTGAATVEPRGSRLLRPGEMDLRQGRFDLHRVVATPEAPVLSLHVYAGPLTEYLVYDETTQSCAAVKGTYDEVLSVLATA